MTPFESIDVPHPCKSIGCIGIAPPNQDFCDSCMSQKQLSFSNISLPKSMAEKYPKYYKPLGDMTEIDVYGVHQLFAIDDASGALQHASKKLLLSGVRTGGKSKFKDIQEARDTLNRWLELNPEQS